MGVVAQPAAASVRFIGHIQYRCFADDCEVISETDQVWWSDGKTVIEPPGLPPEPPNDYLPYCSQEHLPVTEE